MQDKCSQTSHTVAGQFRRAAVGVVERHAARVIGCDGIQNQSVSTNTAVPRAGHARKRGRIQPLSLIVRDEQKVVAVRMCFCD